MADKPENAAEVPAPTVALSPDVSAPAAPATPEPVPQQAPATISEPERTPTLLEKFDAEAKAAETAKAADKPAEAVKAADAAKPAEPAKDAEKPTDAAKPEAKAEAKPAEAGKPAEAAKPEPVEYKYTLPETVKMDDTLKGRTHEAFDELRTTGSAQKLIDLYAEQRTADAAQTLKNQFDVFNKTKSGWETKWLADDEIGGAGHRTALKAIARVRDDFVSSAQQGTPKYQQDWKEFNEFLAITGAGSHPAFARLMHNLSGYVTERQAEQNPVDIKPPKDIGKQPGNFKQTMYDHPRSHTNGGG